MALLPRSIRVRFLWTDDYSGDKCEIAPDSASAPGEAPAAAPDDSDKAPAPAPDEAPAPAPDNSDEAPVSMSRDQEIRPKCLTRISWFGAILVERSVEPYTEISPQYAI